MRLVRRASVAGPFLVQPQTLNDEFSQHDYTREVVWPDFICFIVTQDFSPPEIGKVSFCDFGSQFVTDTGWLACGNYKRIM